MEVAEYMIYILVMSASIFLTGRIFPRRWIKHDSFLYRPCRLERNGTIYEKLKVKKWKDKWPNASLFLNRLCKLIPPKRVSSAASNQFMTLIHESCVAESTHCFAIAFGFLYLAHKHSKWSVALSLINCLVNIPPIIIQRYNRPRYLCAHKMSVRRENRQRHCSADNS